GNEKENKAGLAEEGKEGHESDVDKDDSDSDYIADSDNSSPEDEEAEELMKFANEYKMKMRKKMLGSDVYCKSFLTAVSELIG
ncbi:hypothetical protein EJB05_01980, partial [Eragrostis curvula]